MMHITSLAKLALLGTVFASAQLSAAEVFTWKNRTGSNT